VGVDISEWAKEWTAREWQIHIPMPRIPLPFDFNHARDNGI
jgi:hypothetical protein